MWLTTILNLMEEKKAAANKITFKGTERVWKGVLLCSEAKPQGANFQRMRY